MQKFVSTITGLRSGVVMPITGATATIFKTGTNVQAVVYAEDGVTAINQPLASDANGFVQAKLKAGYYDIQISDGTVSQRVNGFYAADDTGIATVGPVQASGAGNTIARPIADWVPGFHVNGFGAVTSTSAPSSAVMSANTDAWNRCLNAASLSRARVVADPGTYYLNSGVIYDSSTTTIDAYSATINFGAVTSNNGSGGAGSTNNGSTGVFLVTALANLNDAYQHMQHSVRNLRIEGLSSTSNVDGFIFSGPSSGKPAKASFYNVVVRRFRTPYEWRNNAYLFTGFGCVAYDCTNGPSCPSGYGNYGENISFHGGAFFNLNNNGSAVNCNNDNADMYFFGVSFDYNPKTVVVTRGKVYLMNCHNEFDIDTRPAGGTSYMTAPPFQVGGNNGAFLCVQGGTLGSGGTSPFNNAAISAIVDVGAGGVAVFDGVFMYNIQLGSNTFKSGAGRCFVRNTRTYNTAGLNNMLADITGTFENLMADGGFANAIGQDLIFINRDTAAITDRYTGTNIKLALGTDADGNRCLKVTKVGSGVAAFTIAVDIPKQALIGGQLQYTKATVTTGTMFLEKAFMKVTSFVGTAGLPLIGRQDAKGAETVDLSTLTAGTYKTMQIQPSFDQVAAASMNHWLIRVNMDNVNAGDYYFKNVVFNSM